MLAHSSLFQQASEDNLLPTTTRSLNGVDVPLYFVGDSAYPLTTWIMKPFPHSGQLSSKQRHFNYRLSRARIVVENAFGRLKARWRRLLKRVDMSVENIPTVIAACCILHNMCEIHGETFMETWMTDVHSEEKSAKPTCCGQRYQCWWCKGDTCCFSTVFIQPSIRCISIYLIPSPLTQFRLCIADLR